MELYQEVQVLTACVILLTVVYLGIVKASAKRRHRSPPEPGGAWPLIGHLRLLSADKLLHRTLAGMADECGPAFSIRLGLQQALVVSNWEVAKECFTVNDKLFSSRPRALALDLMSYDYAVLGFAPYGPYWRDMRKIVVAELLSNQSLERLKHVWDSEVRLLMKEVFERWVRGSGKPVVEEMREKFGDLATNITLRVVAGKRYANEECRRFQKLTGDFVHLVGLPVLSDTIPFLGWLDVLNGHKSQMKKYAKVVDALIGSWMEEHRRNRVAGEIKGEQDFIDVMLSLMEEKRLPGNVDTVIKATSLSMILGSNDTTVIVLTWAIALLLNNRHVLSRAQDELDIHVGKHRQVEESHLKHLVYLRAIVKETLRLYPPLPLSLPHVATEDCSVAGFYIPAGTHLLVNLWKLQRDPNVWSNPLEFRPERFLEDQRNLDVRGQHYELMPFGSGRRVCPGINFALQVSYLTLARLIHGFEMETVSDDPVDMREGPGITAVKATSLEAVFTPRLSPELYN